MGVFIALKDDAGATLSGATKTADDFSETINLRSSRFGFAIDCGTVSGTTPTLDAKIEWRATPSGTWQTTFPVASGNAQAAAQLPQCTTTGDQKIAWFENPFPSDVDIELRLFIDIEGTTPSFDIDNLWFFQS